MRWIKLTHVGFWLHVKIASHIVCRVFCEYVKKQCDAKKLDHFCQMIILLTKSPLCILSDMVPKTEESNILFDVRGVEKIAAFAASLRKTVKMKGPVFSRRLSNRVRAVKFVDWCDGVLWQKSHTHIVCCCVCSSVIMDNDSSIDCKSVLI